MNNEYLAQYGVYAGEDTVLVQVSANLDRLFPSVVPDVIVTEEGLCRNSGVFAMKSEKVIGFSVGFVQPGHKVLKSSRMCIF